MKNFERRSSLEESLERYWQTSLEGTSKQGLEGYWNQSFTVFQLESCKKLEAGLS